MRAHLLVTPLSAYHNLPRAETDAIVRLFIRLPIRAHGRVTPKDNRSKDPKPHMERIKYVFIREDGRTFGISDEPTCEDFDHASYGLVLILRICDLQYYSRGRCWERVPEGVIAFPDQSEAAVEPFHVPPDFETKSPLR